MSENNNQHNSNKKQSISLQELIEAESNNIVSHKILENDSKIIKKLTINQIHEKKKDNKFYLPVLNLNDKGFLDSKPIKERECFTDEVAKQTCLSNCNGHIGLQSACCKLDPNDLEHVLGPISEKWIEQTLKWFNKKGIPLTRHDLVIDFEEGKLVGESLFNNHPVFAKEDTYPILRIQVDGPRYACKFLNIHNGKCTIYSIRPNMCRDYYCNWIKKNFLIKLKTNPETSGSKWTAVDIELDTPKQERRRDKKKENNNQ